MNGLNNLGNYKRYIGVSKTQNKILLHLYHEQRQSKYLSLLWPVLQWYPI